MNLTWTVFFVVLAAGIHNVHAAGDWDTDGRRLWTHFLELIQTLQSIVIPNVGRRRDGAPVNDPATAYASVYSDLPAHTAYIFYKRDCYTLMDFTRKKLRFFVLKSKSLGSGDKARARAAIEKLTKDICYDNILSEQYKKGKLPLRDYLMEIYINAFDGEAATFSIFSPEETLLPVGSTSAVNPNTARPPYGYTAGSSNIRTDIRSGSNMYGSNTNALAGNFNTPWPPYTYAAGGSNIRTDIGSGSNTYGLNTTGNFNPPWPHYSYHPVRPSNPQSTPPANAGGSGSRYRPTNTRKSPPGGAEGDGSNKKTRHR